MDASKAFDRVNHATLFKLLIERNLPPTVLRFLFSWYRYQKLAVRWNADLSASFNVTNGVRQGGVLSPILFTVYVDAPASALPSRTSLCLCSRLC